LGDALVERYGQAAQAVLFYGSCLRSGDPLDGLVDLYVIVNEYRFAYGKSLPSFFNARLPPNVYYLEVPFQERKLRAKYAILSLRDLRKGTSMGWFHSYLWGRFAQPTSVIYARDARVTREVHLALAQAVVTFVTRTLPCLPEQFGAVELWRQGLSLSYRSELRTEKPGRAKELVDMFRDEYERLTEAVVPALPWAVATVDRKDNTTIRYQATIPARQRCLSAVTWGLRRLQGKLLSVLRLMKSAFTFQGGVDYIVWKLERHTGIAVEVTPRLRRYPLIFIWPHFWRLYRRGAFR
jgi:hypothetical protein